MQNGIKFFNLEFNGTKEEALRWIVDNQLSPSALGRAAWAEKALQTAVKLGAAQYLVVAAGYDTFAYRQPEWAKNIQIFELDYPIMIKDKQTRVQGTRSGRPNNLTYIPIDLTAESFSEKMCRNTDFDKFKRSFCSLLGIAYYMSKKDFKKLLTGIADCVPDGSTVVFDYPDENTYTEKAGNRAKIQVMMTTGTTEEMRACYSYDEIEELLSDCGFLIYEHLIPDEITRQYFDEYNKANPNHLITAFDNVNYCLSVKKIYELL